MTSLYLTRARLRRDGPVSALAQLLVPDGEARSAASHRLIWALFTDGPDRQRDFLWREEGPGKFLALSSRPPNVLDDLFETETKQFDPALSPGDRLGFTLRANATVCRCTKNGGRGRRHDVVMNEIFNVPPNQRAEARPAAAAAAGQAWLEQQGKTHGFELHGAVEVDGCDRVVIPRDGKAPATLGVFDLSGALTVLDPPRFVSALGSGFGRGRAFGFGLMLVRRVQ